MGLKKKDFDFVWRGLAPATRNIIVGVLAVLAFLAFTTGMALLEGAN